MISLLRQFPGYTLSTLLEEDVELLRLLNIVAAGTKEEGAGDA